MRMCYFSFYSVLGGFVKLLIYRYHAVVHCSGKHSCAHHQFLSRNEVTKAKNPLASDPEAPVLII